MDRLRILSSFVGLMVVFSWVAPAHAEPSPKWTDTSGKFSIVAEFVQVDGDIVVLRKGDGQEIRVPMTKLSSPSRVQARKAAKAMGASGAPSPVSDSTSVTPSVAVPFPEGMSCEQTVRYLADEPAKGNYRVLFDWLPAKHQADVSDLIHLAGKQIDSKLFSEIEATSVRLVQTLRSKKSYVLGCPMLEQYSDSKYIPVYDAGVNMIAAVMATKIINPKNMQSSDHGAMIGAYLRAFAPAAEKLASALDEAGLSHFKDNPVINFKDSRFSSDYRNRKFTVEPISETMANVMTEINGNGDQKVAQTWYLVDGRWVSQSAEAWEKFVQNSKDSLNALSPESQSMALEQLKKFNSQFLSKLESVKSQQEFDAAVVQVVMMAGPMLQQMGGGSLPGGGMPPPAFGPDPNLPIE